MAVETSTQSHILVIDHSMDVLNIIRELLGDEGYRVSTRRHSGQEIGTLEDITPDLIVIDYIWNRSDDNWSQLRSLRLMPAARFIPIVLCTVSLLEAPMLELQLVDLHIDVVLKPFDIDLLLAVIGAALARPATSPVDDDPILPVIPLPPEFDLPAA